QLEDPPQVGLGPAAHELEAIGGHPAFVPEPAIDGYPILAANIFNDHEQHALTSKISSCTHHPAHWFWAGPRGSSDKGRCSGDGRASLARDALGGEAPDRPRVRAGV